MTLRQMFYRLVAAEFIPNTQSAYKTLSARTARARREGWFPALADNIRSIERAGGWDGPSDALGALADQYRRPRDEGQDYQIWLLVEKRTLVEQLRAWFDPYGVAIVALGGYESETLDRRIRSGVADDGRAAIGLYGGDMDPTGEDIERNLTDHCGHVYESLERVALTWEQIDHHALPVLAGKRTDSRAGGFARRHGRLAQVEIEALDPNDLRAYFEAAIAERFDMTLWEDVMEQERSDREYLLSLAGGTSP